MLQKNFVISLLCLVAALSFSATSAMGADVLFIVADPTEGTFTADGLIKTLLEGLGHTVTYFDDNDNEAAMEAAAAAADLVYISESVGSGNVHSKITEIETPMIVGEPYAWDEMGMTRGGGGTSDVATTDIEIVNPGHFLAAGLRGTVTVLTNTTGPDGTAQFANGQVGGDGTVVATATLADGQTYDIIVVYDKGDRLAVAPADGSPQVAADIRVGMFFHYYAQPVLNQNGWALVKAGVNYALGLMEPPGSAKGPSPANVAIDVPREVVLNWTPGEFAGQHDVYFGTSFDDVNNATNLDPMGPDKIYRDRQGANSYSIPERLDFGQTYYWRVDEVNAPPTSHVVFKGNVWSFTVEPVGYPLDGNNISATASSSFDASTGPENTVDGSGLDENDLHSVQQADVWLTSMTGQPPVWIQYEFDKVYKLHEMWVWNFNQVFEAVVGFGLKDVTIEYSTNGADWTALAGVPEFAKAPGAPGYARNTTVDFGGVAAKYVKITANDNWGFLTQYGLSEVRFFYIPIRAKEPNPASGATNVDLDVILSFRAGREAAEHDVYFGSDEQAVIDGTAPVTTVSQTSYGTTALDLGTTYYWKVNEVNLVETPTTWEGDVWNFATPEFLVVEDFEGYDDFEPNRIFDAWIDGWGVPTNGATAGYPNPIFTLGEHFVETTIVHGGAQSAPLFYDNAAGAAYSEAELPLSPPQDWTKHGVETLSLWFYGDPNNTPVQMYVKVNGSEVAYDGDADNLTRIGWQTWNIDLASFGAGLANVTKLAIGFTGGGSGVVFFDGIRLYPYGRQLITPVEPDPANLAAHWQLDGSFNDSSGNGLHGTAMGNATFVAGKIGQAISLDGAGDYVNITGYKGILGPNAVTVTAWIRTSSTATGAIVGWGPDIAGQRFGFRVNEGRLRTEHHGGNVQGDTTLNDGGWHHVAVTVQANSTVSYPEVILWLDGLDDTRPTTDPDAYNITAAEDVSIGRRPASNDRFFMGQIDEVRIYDRALSPEEIAGSAGRTKPFDKPFRSP